jgi:hypothetical protein
MDEISSHCSFSMALAVVTRVLAADELRVLDRAGGRGPPLGGRGPPLGGRGPPLGGRGLGASPVLSECRAGGVDGGLGREEVAGGGRG